MDKEIEKEIEVGIKEAREQCITLLMNKLGICENCALALLKQWTKEGRFEGFDGKFDEN